MSHLLADEILRRIHLKKMQSWAKVKSLTLGIEIYTNLKDELYSDMQYYYIVSEKPEFAGLPIKISYKRPRLIQINLDIERRKTWHNKFLTIYANNLYPKDILFLS